MIAHQKEKINTKSSRKEQNAVDKVRVKKYNVRTRNKFHQKGEQNMSRTLTTEEKEILKIMVKAFPLMSGEKKYQLLGYGQAMIDLKRNGRDPEADSLAAS